ncbi:MULTISPECIES: pyruvate dehydrogenase complex dihydrolipoamide acetyltransferase [Aequorivita]|uniref:Acetyltransferase component of pyruvate dehydrogenase complex n=1 Tax=Aequorivita iocasae TaxID=2803865 RepID=A0ABX7DTP8_9FLAO|nr:MULTISPECIES: pyruvate dehydrogenase complex dihydrolipoamide acetyltransferase [Aequorivita]QQX77187.1 pyruvate dehydrogenase complex dihydrolipoamide acetyltransferase [Aequorivita iocasae]UCA56675.1 pyruvate dehydrogenase complex dihydrolipoamide acetyltransferase [Aequorivita sp. F7]
MAEVINMPRLSDTMEEGTVATWLKKVGDTVKEGDILAEIETDKATMEFESFYEGTLLHIGIKEGETAKVDSLLAIIGEKDEDISDLIDGKSDDKKSAKETSDKKSETSKDKEESKDITEENSKEKTENSSASSELPEGVEVITMPRLSDTMTEGTVASWLKKEGDKVEEGDILAEIETDKATMEFESFYSGTLLKIGVGEGESASVDALLAIIGPKGTDVSGIKLGSKPSASKEKVSEEKKSEEKETIEKDSKKESSSTKALEDKRKSESSQTTNEGRIFVSPLAKKLAEEKGINLRQVRGSGENGRIVKSDIENYQPAAGGGQAYIPVGTESFEEVKNSQMRKTIAKRLAESKFTAPEYYLTVELDMDHAIAAREAINADPDVKISFNDMVIKACAMALRKHPQVNSQWTPEATKIAKHIHIGVAVAVDEGLLVPVLKFADQMTFSQIGAQVKELAGKARNKKITPQEMEGSTFTVSNLGMFGITEFTSIINQPNSAILSVGAIVQKPVVKNGQIAVGNTMTVTLACDHRTVDGATGAKFLQTLRQYIENPVTMFV